jgi:hypothetical protein
LVEIARFALVYGMIYRPSAVSKWINMGYFSSRIEHLLIMVLESTFEGPVSPVSYRAG